MPKASLYNMSGSRVGEVELAESVFGQEVNKSVLHSVVVNYLANQRQGTQSTKTRSEVSGGGKKPFRQKGTGRARQGSTRASQWVKGGIALGPKPRDYSYNVNKSTKKVAMKSALSAKAADEQIFVVDNLTVDEVKTKTVASFLKAIGANEKTLIVTADKNENVYLSGRNIEGVKVSFVGTLNVYDILKYDNFVVAEDAVKKLEEVYA